MKIRLICFTQAGKETGEKVCKGLFEKGHDAVLDQKGRFMSSSIKESSQEWAARYFCSADALVFVSSCGIAVRSIASLVSSKMTDPAVLVIDECGKLVISLLSGHVGGANDLTREIASMIGAVPVITTATDLHQVFAADLFAKKNGCRILNPEVIKMVSGALLQGEKVGFCCDFSWEGLLPEDLLDCTDQILEPEEDPEPDLLNDRQAEAGGLPETGIVVTPVDHFFPFRHTLVLVPPVITLGIGCKKGKSAEDILAAAEMTLEKALIRKEAVEKIATIDLKKDEPGIRSLAGRWKVPLVTYTAEELRTVKGNFTPSPFVEQVTGVDNVCERSAVLASNNGWILRRKWCMDGVTTALCQRIWRVSFE